LNFYSFKVKSTDAGKHYDSFNVILCLSYCSCPLWSFFYICTNFELVQ